MNPRLFLSGISVFAAAHIRADTPANAAPIDSGLRQLADLGIPDLAGAKWVSGESVFNGLVYGAPGMRQEDYQTNEVFDPVASHGWMTPVGVVLPGKPAPIDPAAGFAINFGGDAKTKEMLLKQQAEKIKNLSPADLAKDIDGLINRLEAKAAESQKRAAQSGSSNYWLDSQGVAVAGRSLVFAAQILRTGDAPTANRLAGAVFKCFPKRQTVLNAAISIIADSRYNTACEEFKKTGDWAIFAGTLDLLQKDFPRGWERRLAIGKLHALVKKRLSGPAPKLSTPAGVKADEATLAAFDALGALKIPASGNSAGMQPYDSLWLLPIASEKPGMKHRRSFDSSTEDFVNAPEVKALTKSGYAALPVLIAALGDETLTPFFRTNNGGGFSFSSIATEAKTLQIFNGLYRPVTRGEVARALLLQIMPGDTYKFNDMDSVSFTDAVDSFRAAHEKSTPIELALLYLKEGSGQQKHAMINFFADCDDPAAGKIFEDNLLASEGIEGRIAEATQYLRAKRDKGAPFAQKLVAKLKQNLALPGKRPEQEYGMKSANGITRVSVKRLEAMIAEVEDFADGRSPREKILEAVAKPANEALVILRKQSPVVSEMPLAERVPLLLEAACAAKDAEMKSQCLSLIGGFRPFRGESTEKYTLPDPGSPDAKRWLELIDDDKTKIQGQLPLGAVVARSFESLFEEIPASRMVGVSTRDGKGFDIFRRRAKARLEGREIPAYPDPAKVSAERLKALVDGVVATPDAKLKEYLAGLNDDEQAAWGVWWTLHLNPEATAFTKVTLPEVPAPAALIEREKRIASATTRTPFGELSEEDKSYTKTAMNDLGLAPGTKSDFARIDAFCAALAKDTAKYSGSVFGVMRGADSLGLTFYAHREKIAPIANDTSFLGMATKPGKGFATHLRAYAQRFKMDGDYGYKGSDAVVVLQSHRRTGPQERVWRVKAGKIEAPAALDIKVGEEIPSYAAIVVLTAKDAGVIIDEKKPGGVTVVAEATPAKR